MRIGRERQRKEDGDISTGTEKQGGKGRERQYTERKEGRVGGRGVGGREGGRDRERQRWGDRGRF